MKISTLTRHLREGARNVVRNGWMTFASASAIAISLFILGLFLLVASNVSYIAQQVENQVEIRVFLDVNMSQDNVAKLQKDIAAIDGVNKVTFVSKAEGLKNMREKLGANNEYLDGLDGDNNPLNDSFTVEVKEPRLVAKTAGLISALNDGKSPKPIAKVNYGEGTVETMFKVTSVIRYIGLGLVICLSFTAMFLISNTIKLTILARNREIKIMKLVGATNSFIRWPFFIEGAMLGLAGSIIPLGLLTYGYWRLVDAVGNNLDTFMLQLKPFHDVYLPLMGILLGIGIIIGIWGSTISVRKFLRV